MVEAAAVEIFSFLARATEETATEAEVVGARTEVVVTTAAVATAVPEVASATVGTTVWPSESTTTVS